jgi:hypothetical protein
MCASAVPRPQSSGGQKFAGNVRTPLAPLKLQFPDNGVRTQKPSGRGRPVSDRVQEAARGNTTDYGSSPATREDDA